MECLVIVAHPDDETIWMGGTILRHPDWMWTAFSLCRGDDPDRAPRFRRAAKALGARPVISDLDDGSPSLSPLSPDLREITDRLALFSTARSRFIFTHGVNGEYTRHPRHEQVHQAVREMTEAGILAGTLITFAYDDSGGTCAPKPAEDADIRVTLSPEHYARKQVILHSIYGFSRTSFEMRASGPVEAFRLCGGADNAYILDL